MHTAFKEVAGAPLSESELESGVLLMGFLSEKWTVVYCVSTP
jgi:hypothetical protein